MHGFGAIIEAHSGSSSGAAGLDHRYTRSEVERMMGISRRELNYWTRLRLVLPRSRWGERFFNFSDLVALETIKRLAARKVPARRIRRAVTALQTELGSAQTPLSMLRISTNGKQVVVYPPVETTARTHPPTRKCRDNSGSPSGTRARRAAGRMAHRGTRPTACGSTRSVAFGSVLGYQRSARRTARSGILLSCRIRPRRQWSSGGGSLAILAAARRLHAVIAISIHKLGTFLPVPSLPRRLRP